MRTGFAPVAIPSAPPAFMLDSPCYSPPPSYTEACSNSESGFSNSFRSSHSGEYPPVYLSENENNDSVFSELPTEGRAPIPHRTHVERYNNNSSQSIEKRSHCDQHSSGRRSYINYSYVPKSNRQQTPKNEHEIESKSNKKSHCVLQALNSVKSCGIPSLTRCEADAAFVKLYVKQHKLRFSCNKLKQYRVKDIKQTCVWKYTLTTIYERRQKARQEKPYSESSKHGRCDRTLSEWDVKVDVPHDFTPRSFKMPGSETVSSCISCRGKGNSFCLTCQGEGNHSCDRCGGLGHQIVNDIIRNYNHRTDQHEIRHQQRQELCEGCFGTTMMRCCSCLGKAINSCWKCRGTGKVESYDQVIVQWDPKQDYKFCNKHTFSDSFLKRCEGIEVYKMSARTGAVPPLSNNECICKDVVNASSYLIESHKTSKNGYIVSQCQRIDVIPVYEVTVERPGKERSFWIVGTNHNLYDAGHYNPVGCTIM